MEKGEIILYQPNETIKLEVRLEEESVWLTSHQLALLFNRDVKTIGIQNEACLSAHPNTIHTPISFRLLTQQFDGF